MRWSFIHQWKTCLVTRATANGTGVGGEKSRSGDKKGKMRIRDGIVEEKIQNTSTSSASASAVSTVSGHSGASDETDTDLITVSVTNDTLKRWSVGSATNSEGEYSKVVVQFGSASELNAAAAAGGGCGVSTERECECEWDHDYDFSWETDTLKDENETETLIFCNGNGNSNVPQQTRIASISGAEALLEVEEIRPRPLKRSNGGVCFVIPTPQTRKSPTKAKTSPSNESLIVAAIENARRQGQRPSVSSGSATVSNASPGEASNQSPHAVNQAQAGQVDRWRVLFDRFDLEGFGEIPWDYFYYIALRSPYFINEVEPGKLEVLRDLAKDKLQQLQEASTPKAKAKAKSKSTSMSSMQSAATICTAITFQYFVNIMSGKRSRSFKCAVHHRDREVSSENDFHLASMPSSGGESSRSSVGHSHTAFAPPSTLRQRLASCLASEFLTDDRDRKFFTRQYNCCPPPVFFPVLTLIQAAFFLYYVLYHSTWPDEELQLEEEVFDIDVHPNANDTTTGAAATPCFSFTFTTPYYKPTPIASSFVYRPDRKREPWRFVFYALLHASWPHFAFNAVAQLLIGTGLEMVHGTGRIFFVYIVATIGSALSVSVLDPTANLIGGAGGVYALLVAHCANVLLYSQSQPSSSQTQAQAQPRIGGHDRLGLARLWRVTRILLLLLAASLDVGIAVFNRHIVILAPGPSGIDFQLQRVSGVYVEVAILRQELAPISYLAHITGAVLGLNVGLVVLRNFEQSLRQQLIWWCTLCVCALWALGAVMVNVLDLANPNTNTNTLY